MTSINENKICGRDFTRPQPGASGSKWKPKARFVVDGIFHPAGQKPIRFKSREAAERHIKNMGWVVKEST